MRAFSFLSTFLSLSSLALAQNTAPFPFATHSVATTVLNKVFSDIDAYLTSAAGQPAYTSASVAFAGYCNDGDIDSELCNDSDADPLVLATAYALASTTPDWYSGDVLPSDLLSYVSSAAGAVATIGTKDESAAPGSIRAASGGMLGVWVCAVAAGAVLVGAVML